MEKYILPPDDAGWFDEQFSVVQGFDICTSFFTYLWPSLKAKFSEMSEDDVGVYSVIFTDLCMGFETSAEWNKAIYRIKKNS